MRRGLRDQMCLTTDIIEGPNGSTGGQIIGISLGWDFCAEHEWGIQDMQRSFGIPGKPERRKDSELVSGDFMGADVRTITKLPAELKFFEDMGGFAYLLYSDYFGYVKPKDLTAKRFNDMLDLRDENEEFSTAWSEDDFGVRMKNDIPNLGATVLGQIYEAFQNKDAMIFLGGNNNGGPFSNRSLILAIRSRIPENVLKQMKEADEDSLNLMDAVTKAREESRIEEKLKAAGKEYYALSPRWAESIKSTGGTKYPVVFWLNPMDQSNNNYGYYTVEQLLEWAEGKGPIPKTTT